MPTVLFCPFCREPFDGVTECPDHGIALVSLEKLSADTAKRAPDDDARLAMHDVRFGRGIVLLGAFLVWLSIGLPAVHDGFREGSETTGFVLWSMRADYLTVVPGAAVLAVFTVFMRTTRAQLRRVRFALFFAVAFAFMALALAAWHVASYADELRAAGEAGEVSPGSGAFVALLGLVVLAIGTWRLGRAD